MIAKYATLFLAACVISAPSYGNSKFGVEELVISLGEPATWRALGTIKPGIEDGVPHDIYRNSAVIAAVVQSNGVDVPFVKLTNDPAAAPKAFVDYITRVEQDKSFRASDESCGIGVSHLYAIIFGQLLTSKGPQWVKPGSTSAEAQAMSKSALDGARMTQGTLAKLCDGWKYRKLNAAFIALVKRVDGEMPYLLGGPLRTNQATDNKLSQAADALAERGKQVDESRRRGAEMVNALKGISPAVTQDPFAQCIGIANDSGTILKDQCIGHVMESATQDHNRLFSDALKGISPDRAKAIQDKEGSLSVADYKECNKPEQDRLAKDDGGGPRTNEAASEIFSRCHFVRLKQRESALRTSPPLSDIDLAAQKLNQANDIGRSFHQLDAMPLDTKRAYLAALNESSLLGNMSAKTLLAQIKSQNLEDIQSLVEAEHLLNQIDKARASTTESTAVRESISFPLHAWRLANSPEQKRKDLRTSLGTGTDDAQRAALAMDQMSRNGGMCDTLVVQAYNYATDGSMPENVRMMIINGKLLDTAVRMSCIR